MGYYGPLPDDMEEVLDHAWETPISVASNYARAHLTTIALAASLGWLSTVHPDGLDFTKTWHITASGLSYFKTLQDP